MVKSQSCRGTQNEVGMLLNMKSSVTVGKNSTCVLGHPNEQNFVNLFAAVECKSATK